MSLFRMIARLFVSSKPPPQRPSAVEVTKRETVDAPRPVQSVEVVRQYTVERKPPVLGFQDHLVGKEISGKCFVIDGDTITIRDTTIRLYGIDAPEMDQPWGKKAKWELAQLCRGQTIRAVFDGTLSHERGTATCYLPDGRDLSAEMVKMGLALDWPKFSGGNYRSLEPEGIRKTLWRVDARQKGRMPPKTSGGIAK